MRSLELGFVRRGIHLTTVCLQGAVQPFFVGLNNGARRHRFCGPGKLRFGMYGRQFNFGSSKYKQLFV